MLGDMFLWLVANLKQGVIYFIKQALPPNISAGSVPPKKLIDFCPERFFRPGMVCTHLSRIDLRIIKTNHMYLL